MTEFKADVEEGQCPQCGAENEELFFDEITLMFYCEDCWIKESE